MAKSCPRCRGALRRDETLSVVQTPDGIQGVCPRCKARVTGEPEPPPRLYPVGCRMPHEPGHADAPLKICGLCRQALFWDDHGKAMRVPANDQGVEPGVYHACGDCVTTWQPAIALRLETELGLKIDDPRTLAGNMLL